MKKRTTGISMRTAAAVAVCRFSRFILRKMRRGGTALPGVLAMKVKKDVLRDVSAGVETIVVTGTNGKTTTARMIEHALTAAGCGVLANKSGANLLSGVTAEFAASADWRGRPKKKYAVIECDEGALHLTAPLLEPKVIVVTNLFRDQLDRYGEVMHTLEAIRAGIQEAPEALLCLNADDSLVASLAFDVPNPVAWFGLETAVRAGGADGTKLSDARYCIRCGTEYRYHFRTYAHLGDFYCPSCGYARHKPDVAVTSIDRITAEGTDVHMQISRRNGRGLRKTEKARQDAGITGYTFDSGKESKGMSLSDMEKESKEMILPDMGNELNRNVSSEPAETEAAAVRIGTPAVYNVYNAAAAVCAFWAAGFPAEKALSSLADVSGSFGRMETFDLDGVRVQMILVKNPAGCNQALEYLLALREPFAAVLCLNDLDADGHDISWIWDADYERLCADPLLKKVYVWGIRAEDMQLRLKYAGKKEAEIELVREMDGLIAKLRHSPLPVFVLPNYTTMLPLRDALSRATGKEAFWEG